MAGQRPYRAVVPRKNEQTGKTYWTQIGVAFKRDTGSISILLDALPLGNEIVLFPPDDGPARGGKPPPAGGAPKSDTNGDDGPY